MTQKEYISTLNNIGAFHGLAVISVQSVEDTSTKIVEFNKGLKIQMQQSEVDTKAFAIVLDYAVKNVLAIDRKSSYGKTLLVCINLDNPGFSFVASETLINSLVKIGAVDVVNMKVNGTGVEYAISTDDTINAFDKKFCHNGKWSVPCPIIRKAGSFYVLTEVFDGNTPGLRELHIPDFVDFIAIGEIYRGVYRKRYIDKDGIIVNVMDNSIKTQLVNSRARVCNVLNAKMSE